MRVAVLSSTFPSSREPTRGVFVHERIRRLARRAEVRVVAPVPWAPFNRRIRGEGVAVPAVEEWGGLTVRHPRFPSLPRYGKSFDAVLYAARVALSLARLRRTFDFELIDAHFEYPDAVAATLLGRWFRRPVVVTLRGKLVRLARDRWHRPQLRWMLRRADRVVSVSHFLRRLAEERLDVPAGRIRVIRNGVDGTLFAPMPRAEARRRCGLPGDGPVLLTVGGIEAHKGQHRVVEALPALVRERPGLRYVVVGAGRPGDPYERDLRRATTRLCVADHVVFAGRRPHGELRPWFGAADLLVLLTRSEGWPNVVLESLACGTPVLATDVGGVPEILRDGTDGILVPYGDQPRFEAGVREALDRGWDREAIGARARTLDWSEVVEQTLEEWTAALKGTEDGWRPRA